MIPSYITNPDKLCEKYIPSLGCNFLIFTSDDILYRENYIRVCVDIYPIKVYSGVEIQEFLDITYTREEFAALRESEQLISNIVDHYLQCEMLSRDITERLH